MCRAPEQEEADDEEDEAAVVVGVVKGGERRTDREAARAGLKPIQDIADLAFLTPEEGEEFIEAIRQTRSMDKRARGLTCPHDR